MSENIGGVSPESAANLTHYLRGISFPAGKKALIEHARKNGAGDAVIKVLNGLENKEWHSMADVMQSYGKEKAA